MGKIKSSIVAILLILSVLLVAMNFAAPVAGPANDSTARAPRLTDADFHWGSIVTPSEPTLGQDNNEDSVGVEVAVENENVYVVWTDYTDLNSVGANWDIFFRMYDGTSWSNIEFISEPALGGADDNGGSSFNPDIAVENGNIYVVWEDDWKPPGYSAADDDIMYRHYDGTQWGPIQVISEPNFSGDDNPGDSYSPAIAVDNGEVYVVWRDNTDITLDGTFDHDIFYRANLTGSSWEDIQVISEPVAGVDAVNSLSVGADIAADNNQHYIVWKDDLPFDGSGGDGEIFYRANLTNSWEGLQVISEPTPGVDTNFGDSKTPSIAVETDMLYVVWSDDNDTNGASGTNGDYDVFYRANLTQSNWEATQVLSEPIPNSDTNDGDSEDSSIAVENDVIYVIWNDMFNFKNSSITNNDHDIFFTYNSSGGGWSEYFIVSEIEEEKDNNDGGSKADTAIAVNLGKCHIFWDDNNDTESSGTDWDINYRPTFVAPSLTSQAVTPAIGNTSTVFKYTVIYTDPDNEAPTQITITVNGGTPEPMTASTPGDTLFVDGNEYFYETTLDIGTTHDYEFSTSDGVYTRGIGPFDGPDVLNTAPNITTPDNATAQEDWYYEVDYEYEDIDIANIGQVGTWNLTTNASWLEFNTTTGILNGTPTNDEVGDYWVNVTINDTMEIDWVYFILTVNNTNDPPSLLPDELPHAIEDELYEVVFEGADIDKPAQTLFWHIKTNASWLTINTSLHKISGTPTNAEVGGEFWVDVVVEDGDDPTNRNYTLIVDNVNDLPVITTDDVTTTIIDELYSVAYEATDDDLIHGDVLTWSLDTNAAWLALNASTGVLSGTPTALGTHYVNVSVDDGNGGLDYSNFTITVEEPPILNEPPVIITDNVLTATVDVEYTVVYNATDDHTVLLNLTWTWETNAAWLNFNATSRELSGTPAETDVGLPWVNITVADDDAVPLMAWSNFTINVTKPPEPSNHEPELSNSGMTPASGDEDTEFTFSVHYTDEDGDPPTSIQVVIDGEEHDMFLKEGENATDGVYEYKTKLPKGNHTYYFKANDGELEAVPGDITTPTSSADAAETPSIKEAEEDEDGADWILWVAIIIIIVIVIAILAFAMMRRKPARPPEERAPEEEEELAEWEDEEGEEEEWEEEEGEEGEEEEWEDEGEEGEEAEEDEWEEEEEGEEEEELEEEEEAEEELEEEEAEEEEELEEEEEAEEELEEEEAEEELPPVKSIDCPKCKTEMEVPFSEDPKVGLECPSCGAKGKISNPYLE